MKLVQDLQRYLKSLEKKERSISGIKEYKDKGIGYRDVLCYFRQNCMEREQW